MNDANAEPGTPATAAASILFPPTTDDGTAQPTPTETDLAAKLDRASDRAVDAFGSKRKPGQRGPDKQKRRPKVPVGDVAGSSAETLFSQSEGVDNPPLWQGDAPGLDAETAEALADVVYELFKDGRENFWRLKVYRLTGDQLLADNFIRPVPEKLESAMRKSAKALVMKWGARIEYAPEITFMGAAAVLVVGDFLRFRGLKKDHEQERQQPAA